MQSLTMFIGESLCLIAYFLQGQKVKLTLEPGKIPHKWYVFAVPALSDSISSMLQYMGLFFIDASTYMMFKGASIVTTAIFSKLLFNMKIQKRHFAGCGLAILGLAIVGSAGFVDKNGGSGDKSFVTFILHRVKNQWVMCVWSLHQDLRDFCTPMNKG